MHNRTHCSYYKRSSQWLYYLITPGIPLLRPPSEIDAALVGLPGMRSIDVPVEGFDPLYVLKNGARLSQISRRSSAPNMRALMAGQQPDGGSAGSAGVGAGGARQQPKTLARVMSQDRMGSRRGSTGNKIVVHDKPQIARYDSKDGSSKDGSEYVDSLLKQSEQLSRFSLF
jgi:hypothetical protein